MRCWLVTWKEVKPIENTKKQNPRVNLFFAFLWCRPASAQYCFPASKFASCFLHKHLFPTKSPFRKFLCQHGKILFTCALSRCRSKIFKNIQGFPRFFQDVAKYSQVFRDIPRYSRNRPPEQNGAPWLEILFRDGLALVINCSQLRNWKYWFSICQCLAVLVLVVVIVLVVVLVLVELLVLVLVLAVARLQEILGLFVSSIQTYDMCFHCVLQFILQYASTPCLCSQSQHDMSKFLRRIFYNFAAVHCSALWPCALCWYQDSHCLSGIFGFL